MADVDVTGWLSVWHGQRRRGRTDHPFNLHRSGDWQANVAGVAVWERESDRGGWQTVHHDHERRTGRSTRHAAALRRTGANHDPRLHAAGTSPIPRQALYA